MELNFNARIFTSIIRSRYYSTKKHIFHEDLVEVWPMDSFSNLCFPRNHAYSVFPHLRCFYEICNVSAKRCMLQYILYFARSEMCIENIIPPGCGWPWLGCLHPHREPRQKQPHNLGEVVIGSEWSMMSWEVCLPIHGMRWTQMGP